MDWLPIMPSEGVNLFDAPEALRKTECLRAKNLVPVPMGKLRKRGGLDRPSIIVGGGYPSALVCNPVADRGADLVVLVRAPGAAGYVAASRFETISPDVVSALPFDHPRAFMFPWSAKLYVLPGPYAEWVGPSQAPFYTLDATAVGAEVAAVVFAGAGNGNVYPSVAATYKQRLVLMNFGRGYENTIVFTDDYTADVVGDDVLSSNGRAISLVAGADGDEIVAGIEVMLTNVGSPAEAALLVLRKYGNPFLLTGDMDQTTGGDSTLDIKRISVNAGCAGPYTVTRTPVGIIWAGIDDVWAFAAGVLPTRIGQKIQPALKLTPNQLQYRWSAAYFDGFYRLAVWGEGQGMDATDAPGDQWWLDLRNGLPEDWREAHWWGPQQFLGGASAGVAPKAQTWALASETRAGANPNLFYVDRSETSAGVFGIVMGAYGAGPRDVTLDPAYVADKDYVDPEILVELVTREVVLTPPHQQVNDGIMFTAHPSSPIDLNAQFILDDGEYSYTTTKYMTAEGFLTGSTRLGSKSLFKKQKAVGLYPTGRRAAMQHRFRIYDTAGWVIVTGYNDTLVIGYGETTPPPQTTITVPQGVYTISQLVTAINTAWANPAGDVQVNASGLVEFTDNNYPGTVYLTLGFDNGTGISSFTATEAQLIVSRRLGTILGFATGANQVAGIADFPLTGATAPFKKGVSRLELYGLQANFEVIPRTP